jgi:hypothetical protein
MKKIRHDKGYDRARREEYPGWQDFADAYYWQQRGDPRPMEAYLTRIDEIKAKYPKSDKKGA